MSTFVLSAQPIDERGAIGFDEEPAEAVGGVIEAQAVSITDCFKAMALKLANLSDRFPLESGAAWDLTLTVR